MLASDPQLPWFRQPWFWFVMSPLLVVVVVCAVFIVIAVRYQDDRVVGDYYKEGLLINERMDAVQLARDLGLSASFRFDSVTGEMQVELTQAAENRQRRNGLSALILPTRLSLYLQHPSQQDRDHQLTLRRTRENHYVADVESPLQSRWYVTLTPPASESDQWRIQGEINLNSSAAVVLSP